MSKATSHLVLGSGIRYQGSNERELITLPAQSLPHCLVSGVTGAGKSYFAAALAASAMAAGMQVIVPDITGSTSRILLKILLTTGFFRSPDAYKRLIFLDVDTAAKRGLYVPWNVLQTGFDPYATSETVLEGIRRVSSVQDNYINVALLFKLGSYVLAYHQLPLFPYLYNLFVDPVFRAQLVTSIDDAVVQTGFEQFGFKRDGSIAAAMQPTIKRLQLLVMNPILRYSLGQQQNVLDSAALLRNGRSVIINLKLDGSSDAAQMLATLLMASIEMTAPSRGDVSDRQPPHMCLLVLDEFQTFIGHSETALSAVLERFRKHNIRICLLHQHWAQIPERIQGALSQCGVVVAFHLDRRSDAKTSAELLKFPYDEFFVKPTFVNPRRIQHITPQFYSRAEQQEQAIDEITNLRAREAFIRLPNKEQGTMLYKMRTLDVRESNVNIQQLRDIEEAYIRLYFRPKETIDEEIANRTKSILSQMIQPSYENTPTSSQNTNATIDTGASNEKQNDISERVEDADESLRD